MSLRLTPLAVVLSAAAAFAADPPEPKFRAVTIDDKIQIGYGVAVADVDGDGKPDVLLADKKQFVWYRNPTWEKFLIAENLTEKDNVCLAAQDLDGDGKCELAVGAEWNPADTEKSGAVFYLIPPADRTKQWEAVRFPSVEPTTHRMQWMQLDDNVDKAKGPARWGLVVVPLHGRGNKNGEGAGVRVLLYHPPTPLNDPKGEWKTELIDDSMHMTHNFESKLPYDGSTVLLGGREGVIRLMKQEDGSWHRNVGPDATNASASNQGVGEVRRGILHRDATDEHPNMWAAYVVAVEPMHGNRLVAYPMSGKKGPRILTDKLTEGHALACGDVLGTGSDQIVVGWRGKPGVPESTIGVAVWTSLDAQGEKWRESLIDDNGMACEDLVLADLDGDGKLDIVAAGRATKNVKIYFNETPR